MPYPCEPCFLVAQRSLTRWPANSGHETLSTHLAHRISRHPGDLASHVRRVFLAMGREEPEILFGALTDLCIALGGKGKALRSRMLDMMKDHLTAAQYAALSNGHMENMHCGEDIPWPRFSRLYQPRAAGQELVARLTGKETGEDTDILEQARDHIDCGQIEAARRILENALLAGEETMALHEELLSLYRHTRNYEAFLTMWTQMEGLSPPLQKAWEAVNHYLDAHHSEVKDHG